MSVQATCAWCGARIEAKMATAGIWWQYGTCQSNCSEAERLGKINGAGFPGHVPAQQVAMCGSECAAYGGVTLRCDLLAGHDGQCRTIQSGYTRVRWWRSAPTPAAVKPRGRSAAAAQVFGGG